jgi:DNA-binding XRE family transcriptional regulator
MKKLSPAERLAAKRPRRRAPRNGKTVRKLVWLCNLRDRRERLRLTLDAVAEAVKLSKTALWHLEQGTDPLLTTARKLAAFYGTTTDRPRQDVRTLTPF